MLRAAPLLLLAALMSSSASAKKMDLETHNLLIQKLEHVLTEIKGSESEKFPISLRLADLYAERARLKFMNEEDEKCNQCQGSQEDRKKALVIYKELVKTAPIEAQEKIIMQLAYLNQTEGETKNAKDQLLLVINDKSKKFSEVMVSQAYSGLGEISFREGNLKAAEEYFIQAEKSKNVSNLAFVKYRLAWTRLNQGKQKEATDTLVALLKQKELFTQKGTPASFKNDVTRDLATFLARAPITQAEINLILELSSEDEKKNNLYQLASEAERLGQKESAALVWSTYSSQYKLDRQESLDQKIRMAQLNFDINKKSVAKSLFAEALNDWSNCQDTSCEEIKIRLKNFVTNWHKSEKSKPSTDLSEIYGFYTKKFPKDAEMTYRSAQLSKQLKDWSVTAQRFHHSANLADDQMNTENREQFQKILEGSLFGEIEAAENANDKTLKSTAYDHFLDKMSSHSKAEEVHYQKAHLIYENGDYKTAAKMFKTLALEAKDTSLKIKSADLALDSLVLLKRETDLQSWSMEFSKNIPQRQQEYASISRKSLINQSQVTINDSNSKKSAQAESYIKLKSLSLTGASANEKKSYYKNRLILAERMKDLEDVKFCSEQMLKIKGISKEDRELALSRKAWYFEMKLEFKSAYNTSLQMTMKNLSTRDKQLRLAILAELAGQKPERHLFAALQSHGTLRSSNEIRLKLIQRSKAPWSLIRKNLKQLRGTPDLLAQATLHAYATDTNESQLRSILQINSVRNTAVGLTLSRYLILKSWPDTTRKLAQHRLNKKSDRNLQKSIKERIRLLSQLESSSQRMIQSKDWTLQIIALDNYSKQNLRFYQEIMNLKAPKGLNKSQLVIYNNLILKQAAPYLNNHQQAQIKLKELWSNSQALASLEGDLKNSNLKIQKLVKFELNKLAAIAPNSLTNRLDNIRHAGKQGIDKSKWISAREALKTDPFNIDRIKRLKDAESIRGQQTMVAYLNARAGQLERQEN